MIFTGSYNSMFYHLEDLIGNRPVSLRVDIRVMKLSFFVLLAMSDPQVLVGFIALFLGQGFLYLFKKFYL